MGQDRRVIKTKAAIRAAFFDALKEKNTAKITVTEIARRANIDRKTFYLHYNSAEDILNELYRDVLNEFLLIIQKRDKTGGAFDLFALGRALNGLLMRDIDLYRHIARMPTYSYFWEQIKNILKQAAIDAVAGEVDLPPDEASLYAEYFASGAVSAYLSWLRDDKNLPESKVAEVVGNAAFFGFSKLLPPYPLEGD